MNQAIPSFPDFGKLVPGFDFLQNLAKQAAGTPSSATPQLPNLGNWIAPTLSLEELDKRVQELKAVQFWLDQNATALKATIQALEVQKMTLATLKGMNFNMADMANAFTIKTSESMAGMKEGVASLSKSFAGLEIPPSAFQAARAEVKPEAAPKAAAASAQADEPSAVANGMVDPMQWWGALTQQFQTIATEAMKEVASKTALDATTAMAQEAVKTATDMAKEIAETASKSMSSGQAAMDTVLKSSMPAPAAAKPASRAAPRKPAVKAAAKVPASKTAAAKTSAKTPARKAGATSARKTTR